MKITNRKLWVGGISMLAVTAFGVFCGFVPAAIPIYSTYCMGITGISASYMAGNVAQKALVPAPKEGV
jgi:hypothetical protein